MFAGRSEASSTAMYDPLGARLGATLRTAVSMSQLTRIRISALVFASYG